MTTFTYFWQWFYEFHEWYGMSNAHLVVVEMLATSLASATDLQVVTPPLCGAVGHCGAPAQWDPFSLGTLLAVWSTLWWAGGAEHPAGVCSWTLLLLQPHQSQQDELCKVVTIPCGVCLGLETPNWWKLISQRFVFASQTLPQLKHWWGLFLVPSDVLQLLFYLFFF